MKIMLVTDSKSVGKCVINILKRMYPENVYFLDYTKNIINIKYPSYDIFMRTLMNMRKTSVAKTT